jgi:hypothetical protein
LAKKAKEALTEILKNEFEVAILELNVEKMKKGTLSIFSNNITFAKL